MNTHPLAAAIAAAVAGRDGAQLAAVVTDTVRLRALLPGGPIEDHGREAVVARFGGWFADMDAVDLVESAGQAIADRLLIHYRLALAQHGARWACTQTSICKIDHGRLATIDLLCSGFREIKAIEMRNPALDAWGDYDRDDPYPLFAQVRAGGPVHEVTLADGHRAWLIVRHGEAKAALNHAGLSKDMHAALARDGAVVAEGLPGPAFARHMLSVDPPDHTRLRRLASVAFSRPRIAALRPRVQAIVDGLLDDLEARGDTVVDLVKGFAFPLPFTVISELVGVPEPDQDRLGNWFSALLAPSSAPEPPAEAVAASANIVRYLTGLLARKRAAPGEDLVTDLVRAADQDGALTEQEILSTIFQLVVAGHDTTASLIGNGTVALLLHPEQRDALVADPAQVPHAMEEILRWDAPVPHSTFRYTTADVALGGTVIPAFAQVIVSLAAANRDPARYDHPETLDITRADTSHLAFGHGIHHCLGARLARLEGVIALATLHGRFPAMRLAVPRSALHWGHGDGLVLRGLAELPVILSP
ncbi:MAG TPA: cytochrome P450 [Streptosporangiaceae bacterium]|nr:cytochrome P450 [Streptosporangiaceae bacterium]